MEEQLAYKGISAADRFAFEEYFDIESWAAWTKQHRRWSVPISAFYILLVFSGRRWMEHRPAYRLKGFLILWNILLGGFSLFGAWRTVPILTRGVVFNGWHSSVCNSYYYHKDFVGIWGLLFTLSKIPELGDTLFIVLRKQKLMLLHWYHHASVLLFVFAVYGDCAAPGVWFTTMNYVVHGLMYPYFGLRASGIRLPRFVAMTITTLQIVQMLVGNVVVIYASVVKYNGGTCNISNSVLLLSVSLYFSYLVLFGQFFYSAYFSGKPAAVKADQHVNGFSIGVKGHHVSDEGLRRREFHQNEKSAKSIQA